MLKQLLPSFLVLLVLTLITGLVYPLLVTGMAQALFHDAANGSLVKKNGAVVGSSLIGQQFDDPRYFWSRPSATTPAYAGGASSGSNYGPLNPALKEMAESRASALRAADSGNLTPIPVDLCTASASGLDPHISPAAAYWQAPRVARARNLPVERIRSVIAAHTENRTLGIFGEPRVNVLLLNLSLDEER